jgi:thymidylate synthase
MGKPFKRGEARIGWGRWTLPLPLALENYFSDSVCGINAAMEFKPLHFGDRLTLINPQGTIGVVTLWSKPDYIIERFRQAGVDLNPATSPIAVFGTLYGNGLREMLRNLLYNPQIQLLLICGHDRSGSRQELENFFEKEKGLEIVREANVSYPTEHGLITNPYRIKGTRRLIDGLVQPTSFEIKPRIEWLGDPEATHALGKDSIAINISAYINNFLPRSLENMVRPTSIPPLPKVETLYFPSNPKGHQIVQQNPLEAWKELIFLVARFGRRVTLKKGERLELQNVKVVVEEPRKEDPEKLLTVNLDPGKVEQYYGEFLNKKLRPDETYTYGHRLRKYFDLDAVEILAARLQGDPEGRKAYFSLWDNREDLTRKGSCPCFVSAFFRKFEDKLTLTATFRTHNALDAWPMNFYGLMSFQNAVAQKAGITPGAITVFSHSISIDPKELDRALMVAEKRKWKMHLDPMGYFRITLDGKEILVEHRFEDVTLKEYRGRTAVSLQHQIARDVAVSDLNHAIYLGRQLAKAEMALKDGREFVQD